MHTRWDTKNTRERDIVELPHFLIFKERDRKRERKEDRERNIKKYIRNAWLFVESSKKK
jgi:hypothetical protein